MEILAVPSFAAPVPSKLSLEEKRRSLWRLYPLSEEEVKLYPWRKIVKTLPPSFKEPMINMIKMGHVPELSAFREKVRETLGMDRTPPTAYQIESALKELQELVKKTELDLKVAWNWKEGKSKY